MRTRLLTLLFVIATFTLTATAGVMSGLWNAYPVSGSFSRVLDTGDLIWYVTGGRLNCYDRSSDETHTFTPGSELSDFVITDIYHNDDKGFLAVVYDNSNIDLVYDDDLRVANLPDIKDAQVNAEKGINAIAFRGSDMYVGTDFGLVRYDTDRLEVRESGVYNGHGVNGLAAVDKGLIISPTGYPSDKVPVLFVAYETPIYKYENLRVVHPGISGFLTNMITLGSGKVATFQWRQVRCLTLSDDCTSISVGSIYYDDKVRAATIDKAADGGVYILNDAGTLYHADAEGRPDAKNYPLPEVIRANDIITTRRGPEVSLLAASDDGLGEYKLGADGSVTVVRDKSVSPVATTFSYVARMYPGAQPGKFIISNVGQNIYHPLGNGDHHEVLLNADFYDGTHFSSIAPAEVSVSTPEGASLHKTYGTGIHSPTWLCQDPDRPARFYVGTGVEGLYVIEDGKEIAKFDDSNSPIVRNWVYSTPFVTIDYQGNLWVTVFVAAGNHNIMMLPAEKRKGDIAKVTKADWKVVNFGGNIFSKDSRLLFCRRSPVVLAFDSNKDYALEAITHNGTLADVDAYRHIGWATTTDSDGKTFKPDHWTCGVEDNNGHVWLGTSSGVVSIADPRKVFDPGFTVNRIKVPRNDGTNLADYLLETDKVLCMAVDHSNRKWIGTEGSGLYLVSENGDEIIATYTSDNSMLPSNCVTGLYVDPESNLLYVATLSGLYSLTTTSSPASPDFDNVYAYPNPVTPDYTGWITITGLMDHSLVKIVDSGMHLVYQTVSEGGMAVWDGCNLNGQRVRSGVYYVMASAGDDTSSAGAVATKILVVN